MSRRMLAAAAVTSLLAGCHSQMAGTWRLAPGQPAAHVSVAVMTLAEDGTFTAQAQYGNRTEMMSGSYEYSDGQLRFMTDKGMKRSYAAVRTGDELTIAHEGASVRMMKMKSQMGHGTSGMARANP